MLHLAVMVHTSETTNSLFYQVCSYIQYWAYNSIQLIKCIPNGYNSWMQHKLTTVRANTLRSSIVLKQSSVQGQVSEFIKKPCWGGEEVSVKPDYEQSMDWTMDWTMDCFHAVFFRRYIALVMDWLFIYSLFVYIADAFV